MHTIFTPLVEFNQNNMQMFPAELTGMPLFTTDQKYITQKSNSPARTRYTLNTIVALAFLLLNNGIQLEKLDVYMSAFDANSFSVEVVDKMTAASTVCVFHQNNGTLRALSFIQGQPKSLPAFSQRADITEREILAVILPIVAAFGYQADTGMIDFMKSQNSAIREYASTFNCGAPEYQNALYGISSAVEAYITSELPSTPDANEYIFVRQFPGNNITPISDRIFDNLKTRGSGVIIIDGNPQILSKGVVDNKASAKSFGVLKKEFEDYTSTLHWTDQEKLLIPSFPDDFPVPKETLRMARRFVQTQNDVRPMVQFMWRGPTSYGKSTGVECLAALLETPLLRMTCNTETTTQDFLADFVPDTTGRSANNLPTFDDIEVDPVSAYEVLTGEYDENVTPQQCLEAYALVANKSDKPVFKFVESNYIKGLERGYIVEIQEASRIRNPGVLVGLNEFDRPGSVIPLINGEYRTRHKNAMVIYTDNIGYASCRPIDPSVLRRTALIIDSDELTQEELYARVKFNTKCKDERLIDAAYNIYSEVVDFCRKNDMMDEGSASPTEFEMMVRCLMLDGLENLSDVARECLVNKATSDPDAQSKIMQLIVDPSSSVA